MKINDYAFFIKFSKVIFYLIGIMKISAKNIGNHRLSGKSSKTCVNCYCLTNARNTYFR